MKKTLFVFAIAAVIFSAACSKKKDTPETEPVIPDPVTISIEGHDNMTYTGGDAFKVKVDAEITMKLKNLGTLPKEAMGHNIVILTPGTDLAKFGVEAFKAKDNNYIPSAYSSSIVAHSKLLDPGESDAINFKIDAPGVYEYLCSFPGHWGTMRGKITVEK